MGENKSQLIDRLIEELKAYDKDYHRYFDEDGFLIKRPKEPRKAMEELVKIGEPAIEPLLELLKDTETWSIEYAIEILVEIGDSRAVKPLIKLLDEGFDPDSPIWALQKIGLPALEPILEYLKVSWEKEDTSGFRCALAVLEKIKDERSFKALVDALSHPDSSVREDAAVYLGNYGDKRAFEAVVKVFAEDPSYDSDVKGVVRALAKDSSTYRETLAGYGVVGRERIEELRESIRKALIELESAYRYRFEGDDAETFNAVVREYRLRNGVKEMLSEISELALDEAIISEEMYRGLRKIFGKLFDENIKLERRFEDMIDVAEGEGFPGPSMGESERSYRGLTKDSWTAPLDALRNRVHDWLKKRGFKVHKVGGLFWARKKRARKDCLVYLEKVEGKRIYGKVTVEPCGDGWTENEAEAFKKAFWKNVDKLVSEITKACMHAEKTI